MPEDAVSSYLRLTQFLDLQSQWRGSLDFSESCHRICRCTALLIEGSSVAIGGVRPDSTIFTVEAREGAWPGFDGEEGFAALGARAAATTTPFILNEPGRSLGAFPAPLENGSVAWLFVLVPRTSLTDLEISSLRFVASLCSTLLGRPDAATASRDDDDDDDDEKTRETAARRYVAMAVHDLRNPLNVVSGYTALLEEESLGQLNAEQREAVQAIARQAKTLLSVVDLLIELDRMTAGGSPLEPSKFVVRDLLEDVRATCFAQTNGQVQWPGSEAAFEFASDRRRVFSIVQNLVDNALKHGGDGAVVVDCSCVGQQLVLGVRDHGPGLDADSRIALVVQARTGNEAAPRRGLGLYTIASHVHALGGAIEVGTRVPGGTSIRIQIPPVPDSAVIAADQGAEGTAAARIASIAKAS